MEPIPTNNGIENGEARIEGSAINYSLQRLLEDEQERAHIRRELSQIKKDYAITNSSVIELGCGFGSNLEIFRSDNRVSGVDGLEMAVEEARQRGLNVSRSDLEENLLIGNDSADWVFCLDVLEHLKNPLNLMKEMHRILRSGGRVVINVPNHFDLTGRLKLLLGHNLDVHQFFPLNHEWDNPHLRFFTHRGIRQLFSTAGFRIVEDRSSRFWSFPKSRRLERLGFRPALRALAAANPGLFARGLLLIGQKQ